MRKLHCRGIILVQNFILISYMVMQDACNMTLTHASLKCQVKSKDFFGSIAINPARLTSNTNVTPIYIINICITFRDRIKGQSTDTTEMYP